MPKKDKKYRGNPGAKELKVGNRKNLFLDRPMSIGGWPEGEYEPRVPDQIGDYLSSLGLLERFVVETLQSHTFEPIVGDSIININPGCKHYQSRGVVSRIETLPDSAGTVATYIVTNVGPTYEPGDVLEKTLDQLELEEL